MIPQFYNETNVDAFAESIPVPNGLPERKPVDRRWRDFRANAFMVPGTPMADGADRMAHNEAMEEAQQYMGAVNRTNELARSRERASLLAALKNLEAQARSSGITPEEYRVQSQPLRDRLLNEFGVNTAEITNFAPDMHNRSILKYDDKIYDAVERYEKLNEMPDELARIYIISVMKDLANDKGNITEGEQVRYIFANLDPKARDEYLATIQDYINTLIRIGNAAGMPNFSRNYQATLNDIQRAGNNTDKILIGTSAIMGNEPVDMAAGYGVQGQQVKEALLAYQQGLVRDMPINRKALLTVMNNDLDDAIRQRNNAARQLRVAERDRESYGEAFTRHADADKTATANTNRLFMAKSNVWQPQWKQPDKVQDPKQRLPGETDTQYRIRMAKLARQK